MLKLPKFELEEVLNTYKRQYRPSSNEQNLLNYINSDDYKRHAATARIYYNASELTEPKDALRVIFQREPTNINMGFQYEEEKLQKLFGYKKGVYNADVKKTDGSSFRDAPNSAAAYAETYLWKPPGSENKVEIACLSLPSPALDTTAQPHYKYYVPTDRLDKEKYEKEMEFLFKVIEKTVRDNKENAFGGKGIKRLVLSKFGQGAFLHALGPEDRQIANNIYKRQMRAFIPKIQDMNLDVVMSEYSDPGSDKWYEKIIVRDIKEVAKEHDLIINPWDPHSAPGNGNDGDPTFDGSLGKASGILLTQTSWLNENLRKQDSLVAVT